VAQGLKHSYLKDKYTCTC